jgi:hypothetical protein
MSDLLYENSMSILNGIFFGHKEFFLKSGSGDPRFGDPASCQKKVLT